MKHATVIGAVSVGLVVLGLALTDCASAQGPPRPRPGLTAQQAKEAIELAKETMRELRKKTEGASEPGADLREYVIRVELAADKEPASPPDGEHPKTKPPEKEKAPGPRVVVTAYRYFDDMTVFSTIDLSSGKVVDVQAAVHLRTPLSEVEFEEARDMARERVDAVKQLYERFGDQLKVYPQFSQFSIKDDPRVHRVVHLTYRIGKRDLSFPRPQVDLTTREIETPVPAPEAAPKVRARGDQ